MEDKSSATGRSQKGKCCFSPHKEMRKLDSLNGLKVSDEVSTDSESCLRWVLRFCSFT